MKEIKMRSNRYFLLAMLTMVGVLNFVDRQILSILLEAIKADLAFSDFQLGLLSGTLFAVFYSVVGIPVARLADRWDRGKIVSIALFVWSAMTVVSGFASSFSHMALARIGVAVGESGVAPSSHSLIADRFTANRATALAVYSLGGIVGVFLALSVGGWISDNYGWRSAFFAAGLPGVLLAFVAIFFVKDLRKSETFSKDLFMTAPGKRTLLEGVTFLWALKAWRYAAIASAFTHIASLGIGAFLASFLIRSYELSATNTGLIMAVVIGTCATIGSLGGGMIADKLSVKYGIQWLSWTLAVTFALGSLLAPLVFMSTDLRLFVALLAPYYLFTSASAGVQFAIAQSVVGSSMRATSSAVLILMINLFGLGIGPVLLGFLSDQIGGSESLRYAMLCMTPFTLAGAYYYYKAGVELPNDALEIEESVVADK
jgi:predicted MFS family arabinose efflux permease